MDENGWQLVQLGEVADVQTGIAKNTRAQSVSGVEVPYLRVANVQDGYLDLTEMKSVVVDAETLRRYSLREGDVLFTEGGDLDKLGRGCVWRGQVQPCIHQNHVFVVRPRRALLSDFLAFYASSAMGKAYFLGCAKRTTNLASINSTQLKGLPVPLPSLAEQRKIAAILSAVDEAIEATQAVIDQLQVVRSAMMAELLMRGLPGRHTRFKQTEIGKIADGWTVARVRDVSYLSSGGTPSRERPEFWGGGIPWVKTGEVNYREINTTEETISVAGLENSSAKLLPSGTLLMAMYGQGSTRGRVALLGVQATVNQACLAIQPSPVIGSHFLFYVFSHRYSELRTLGHEGTQKNLNAQLVGDMLIPIPSRSEQDEICEILGAFACRIEGEEEVLRQQHEVKRALMSGLLTGEVRVTSDEVAT